MRLPVLALLTSISLAQTAPASTAPAPRPDPAPRAASAAAAELSVVDAIILGAVEGVTEYLPISSTGHLIIATRLLRLDSEQPLVGSDGQPLWHKKPSAKNPQGEPLTD